MIQVGIFYIMVIHKQKRKYLDMLNLKELVKLFNLANNKFNMQKFIVH